MQAQDALFLEDCEYSA